MAKTRKRVFALLMTLVMVLGLLPTVALAEGPEDRGRDNNIVVTVKDRSNQAVSGATVTLYEQKFMLLYGYYWDDVEAQTTGPDGTVTFRADRTTKYYVKAEQGSASTESVPFYGSKNVTLTLDINRTVPDSVTFNVYRLYENEIPDEINKDFGKELFGPASDDTPYFSVTVNMKNLLAIDGMGEPEWKKNPSGNDWWWYVSLETITHTEATQDELADWFWDNVLSCMSASDKAKFKEYFGDSYRGYVLKQESGAAHIDGVVRLTPPAYTVELYVNGSLVVSNDKEGGSTHSVQEVYDLWEGYLENKYGAGSMNWGTMTYTADDGGVYQLVKDTRYTPNWPIGMNAVQYTQLGDRNFNVARFYVTIENVTPETYTVEYKWVTGSEEPAGVNLPTAQTNLESLESVNVAPLPTAEGYTITGWHVANDKDRNTVNAGANDLTSYASGNKVTLYAYCEAKGALDVEKTLTSVNGTAYDGTSKVKVGDVLTYTITVTNTGNKTLSNIEVQDIPGSGLSVQAGAVVGGTIDSLAKGESETYTVTATVQASASGGSVTNTATATCGTLMDEDEVTTSVEPALTVNKTVTSTNDKYVQGDTVTYSITVKNNTNEPLENITVTDKLPAELTAVNGSEGPWTIASLAAGATSTSIDVTATVTGNPTGETTVTNKATATASVNGTELKGEDTATITLSPTGTLTIQGKTFVDKDGADISSLIPSDYAPTFYVYQGTDTSSTGTIVGNAGGYTLAQIQTGVTIEKLGYGTYTIVERFTSPATGHFSAQKEVNGELVDGQYNWKGVTVSGTSAATVMIDSAQESVSLVDTYEWVQSDKVTVKYAWTTDSVEWPEEAGTDPLTGNAYQEKEFKAGDTGDGIFTSTDVAGLPSAAALPDGYTLTGWYLVEGGDVAAVNGIVNYVQDAVGGTSVTVYAKLTKENPNYQLRYHYFYAEDLTDEEAADPTEYWDTQLYFVDETFQFPEGTDYTVEQVFNAVTGSRLSAANFPGDSIAEMCDGLFFAKRDTTVATEIKDEVTKDGLQDNGKYQYTVNVYFNRATRGDLTITKTFSGIEALPENFQITLEYTLEFEVNAIYQENITVVLTTGADSDVAPTVSGKTYTWVLEDFPYDTELTVTESNYEVDDYSVDCTIEGQTGTTAEVTFTQANDTIAVVNEYTGAAYRVIFLAGDHGVMNITTNSTAVAGDYTRYIWATTGTPEWRNEQPAGVKAYNKEAHYDFTQDQLDAATATLTTLNAPGVTADEGWTFQGFYLVQDGQMTNEAYQNLARVMALFQEQKVSTRNAETPVLVFQADYSQTEEPYVPPTNPPEEKPSNPPQFPTDLPDEDVPTTDLPDEDVPQTDLPDEDIPTTDLPDEDVPQTDLPDEDVPMAEAPKTGDNMTAWVLAAGVSGIALVWLAISGKKHKEDNAQ